MVCANKIDTLEPENLTRALEVIGQQFIGTKVVPISALIGENLSQLFSAIIESINRLRPPARPAGNPVFAIDLAKSKYAKQQ